MTAGQGLAVIGDYADRLRSRRSGSWWLAFVVCALAAAPAAAQTQARLAGMVSMPDGSPAVGITVRLEAADERGVTVSADSNKKGKYLIGQVRPGKYRLVVDTHGELVVLRLKGKGVATDQAEKAVLWEIDQEVSAKKPPEVNVGPRNELSLDVMVGPASMTAEARAEADAQAKRDSFDSAFARVKAGDFEGALELLVPLTATTPDHAGTWYLVAFSRERLGQWEEALAATDTLLGLDPKFTGVHLLRGRIRKGQSRLEDAESELRQEIERNADKSTMYESWIVLATVHESEKRLADAIVDLETAVLIDPSRREPLLELAKLYADSGDRAKAADALERAEKAGGMDDTVLLNLAIGYLNEGKADEAERLAIRLTEKGSSDPNLSLAESILARCDLSRGDIASGVTHLERALALDPGSKLAAENKEILASLKRK